ncbi:MAG: MBL fold metallo-hydrolase [Eubacterium sp.]|nr:MBL fold metallo-hydrolase [Eubacterium sp.]
MKLDKISEHVWVYPFEEKRDRPNLSYIHGQRWNLAVDAGHSEEHTKEFYTALNEAGLPLPDITVITHWHWDHILGMHAVNGLTIANEKTNQYIADFKQRIENEGTEFFFAFDESIREEYKDGKPVVVTLPDMVFSGEMKLDLGNCAVRIFQAEAPHTDDSTLIEVIEDKVLILGDCTGGTFPDWTVDQPLAEKLAKTIEDINPEICLPGHWNQLSKEFIVNDLLYGED